MRLHATVLDFSESYINSETTVAAIEGPLRICGGISEINLLQATSYVFSVKDICYLQDSTHL